MFYVLETIVLDDNSYDSKCALRFGSQTFCKLKNFLSVSITADIKVQVICMVGNDKLLLMKVIKKVTLKDLGMDLCVLNVRDYKYLYSKSLSP